MTSTITTVAASPNPSQTGEQVIIRASVVPSTGMGFPSGTVEFEINAVFFASAIIDPATGTAEITTNALPNGTNNLTANYLGDANFAPSSSFPPLYGVTVSPFITAIDADIDGGNAQFALIGTSFDSGLTVDITVNAALAPPYSGTVTFSSPVFPSPGAIFSNNLNVEIIPFAGMPSSFSITSSIPTANLVAGTYNVGVLVQINGITFIELNNFLLSNIIVCMAFDTKILMGDNTWKPIQDIKRGDMVMGDPEGKNQYQVARLNVITVTDANKPDIVVFQQGSLGKDLPRRKLIMTGDHTIFLNGTKRPARRFQNNPKVTRYLGGKISKKGFKDDTVYLLKDILPNQNGRLDKSDVEVNDSSFDQYNLYDLQFETKGTYVAEGVMVKSRCPNSPYTPLPKELYFDHNKDC